MSQPTAPYLSQRASNFMLVIMAFWTLHKAPMMFDAATCTIEAAELRNQHLVAVNWEACSVMPTTATMVQHARKVRQASASGLA